LTKDLFSQRIFAEFVPNNERFVRRAVCFIHLLYYFLLNYLKSVFASVIFSSPNTISHRAAAAPGLEVRRECPMT